MQDFHLENILKHNSVITMIHWQQVSVFTSAQDHDCLLLFVILKTARAASYLFLYCIWKALVQYTELIRSIIQ